MADGDTIGIWVGTDDESLVEEFDSRFVAGPEDSRSREIKRAMELMLALDRALERSAFDLSATDREAKHLLREAIRAQERQEFGRDGGPDAGRD
jgi:hypothetical protein